MVKLYNIGTRVTVLDSDPSLGIMGPTQVALMCHCHFPLHNQCNTPDNTSPSLLNCCLKLALFIIPPIFLSFFSYGEVPLFGLFFFFFFFLFHAHAHAHYNYVAPSINDPSHHCEVPT